MQVGMLNLFHVLYFYRVSLGIIWFGSNWHSVDIYFGRYEQNYIAQIISLNIKFLVVFQPSSLNFKIMEV